MTDSFVVKPVGWALSEVVPPRRSVVVRAKAISVLMIQ
jgi:hypothetical protein